MHPARDQGESPSPPAPHAPATLEQGSTRMLASPASVVRPPRSPRRPQGSPLLAPPPSGSPSFADAGSPTLAPPVSAPAANASTRSTDYQHRQPRAPSAPRHPHAPSAAARILPSHPDALPKMYDSTASTTDDADGELDSAADDEAGAGAALLAERRRREEAKGARRRAKHEASSGRGTRAGPVHAHVPGRASLDTTAAVTHALQLTGQMPLVEGRRGLGFAFPEAEGVNGHAPTYARRASRLTAPPPPQSARRPSARLAVTEDAAVAVDTDSTTGTTRRVRFEQPYRPPGRDRSSSGSTIALQPEHIVFPDALPPPPAPVSSVKTPRSVGSRRSSAASSSVYSPKSAAVSSPPTSLAPSPSSPRPRSPRRATGPLVLPAELHSARSGSRVYFPSGPAKPASLRSYDLPSPSWPGSATLAPVFPSRPRDKASSVPPSPVPPSPRQYFPSTAAPFPSRQRTPFETAAPFPVRPPTHSTTFETTFSSHPTPRTPRSPFPPPPEHSPHARFLSNKPASPNEDGDGDMGPSPVSEAASTERSQRRAQSAPFEAPSVPSYLKDEETAGDELDRMMRAQRRADADERAQARDRDERRRGIQAELLRSTDGEPVPPSPQDVAFDRALLEAEPKRKSLSVALLSEEDDTRRWSTTPTITPETAHLASLASPASPASVSAADQSATDMLRARSEGVEFDTATASVDNGLNASVSSTSSDISSLPAFPDVPRHHHLAPAIPSVPAPYQLFPSVGATPVAVGGLTRPLETERARVPLSTAAQGANRLSILSETGASVYEDAPSSPPAAGGLVTDETRAPPPVVVPGAGDAQQHTREWVEGLADGQVGRSSLDDIGEEPEAEDEQSPPRTPQPAQVTPPTTHPLVFPSPARSSPLRGRDPSATSSPHLPPSLTLHRTHSPATSFRSAGASSSAASASVAPVSHVAAPKGSPRAGQSGYFKPRVSLGKKLGALFGSSGGGAGVGGGGGGGGGLGRTQGIGSQDVLPLDGTGGAGERGQQLAPGWGGVPALHARERSGASASTTATSSSSISTVPPSPTLGRPAPPSSAASISSPDTPPGGPSAGLDALLARFEQEDRERFRGIAAARARAQDEGVAAA